MNRQDKLEKLNKAVGAKDADKIQHDKDFIESFQKLVDEMKAVFEVGVEFNDMDELIEQLSHIGEVSPAVEALRKEIANIPVIPDAVEIKGIDDIIKKLSDTKIESNVTVLPFESEQLEAVATKFAEVIKSANKVTIKNQELGEYIPMRRVVKVGQKLMWDDSQYTGGGGGGSNIPIIDGAVPVVNKDGSPIGGGTGGGLTDVELRAAPLDVINTETVYTTRIDEASATVTYLGVAVPGTVTSNPLWQIKKIDSSSDTSILFADGNSDFDNVWDDRAFLSYS